MLPSFINKGVDLNPLGIISLPLASSKCFHHLLHDLFFRIIVPFVAKMHWFYKVIPRNLMIVSCGIFPGLIASELCLEEKKHSTKYCMYCFKLDIPFMSISFRLCADRWAIVYCPTFHHYTAIVMHIKGNNQRPK